MRIAGCISIASVLALAAACGSGSNAANTSSGDDAGAAGQGEGGTPVGSHDAASDHASTGDAAPGDDGGDYGPYPADHYPLPLMQNFGGAVLSAPKIVTVTFVGDPNRDAERTFDDAVVQGDWWTTVTSGWPIGKGSGGVYAELPTTDVANKTLDDSKDLQPLIAKWISTGALPPPDANTVYAIYFPASTTINLGTAGSCSGFGGYHNDASMVIHGDAGATLVDGGAGSVDVAYAVLPDCGGGADTVTVSHELIEAATDAHPSDKLGWYGYQDAWWGAGGGEVGDACETRASVTWNNDQVTRAWVNAAAKASHDPCQPEAPGEVFYSAAVPTTVVKGIHDPTGGPDYDSDGYIVMKKGDSQTIDVVVFSEAKLPHDVQLLAGARVRGSTDPSQVSPITTGVTATLTPTTGHNGTHVQLKIDVAQSTAPGDYPFFVRAILTNPSDYHSWWAILRVQ